MPYARVSLARASRRPQKDTPCPNPLAQHQPDVRGAHPDHTSCSTAARAVPGCSSQGARLQATTARDRRRRICPAVGTLSSSPAEADAGIAARMANGTGQTTRLTRTQPCGCYGCSTLVRRKACDMRDWQRPACSFIGACCAAHTWVHASPLSAPSRRRRRPRDAILYAA